MSRRATTAIIEDDVQRAVIELKQYYPELKWLHHVPNGGARRKVEAAILKGQGVVASVSDINLPLPIPGGPAGLWLELKRPGEKPTAGQYKFLEDMTAAGYEARWADNIEDATGIVIDYVRRYREAVREAQ